jgi:hypothetical protein
MSKKSDDGKGWYCEFTAEFKPAQGYLLCYVPNGMIYVNCIDLKGITCPEDLANHPNLGDYYLKVGMFRSEGGTFPDESDRCPAGYTEAQAQDCTDAPSVPEYCSLDNYPDYADYNTACCRKQYFPGDFDNQKECEEAGYYWYDNSCHGEPKTPVAADFDNQKECEEAGYYWYNGACHEEPEYLTEFVLNAKDTRPENMSCSDYCREYFDDVTYPDDPAVCKSVGTNAGANNGLIMVGNAFGCWTKEGGCDTVIESPSLNYSCDDNAEKTDQGHNTQWTNCKCVVPNTSPD